MRIEVNSDIHLSPLRMEDKAALVEHLNEREISRCTLRIPFPYAESDAEQWIKTTLCKSERDRRTTHWAIRQPDERLIGACGFDDPPPFASHRAELGYWLARPYWGRGIMTAVVERICEHGFAEFGLAKITAHVFSFNAASARVLEKCGFQRDGEFKMHYQKDGQMIDAVAYGRIK